MPSIEPHMNGSATEDGEPTYQIRESPMGARRKLKVIFMGMGCSGIDFARQLEQRMQDVTLTIYGK